MTRSGQKCLASRNKTPSTKIVFQIFVDGVLFSRGYFCSRRLFGFRGGRECSCPTLFFFRALKPWID
ncbi:hypothetical protein C6P52_14040 [Enterococcus mundtii]|nr:hypothetical protein C6P52_14040 [Enterococcus mundtii]PTO42826.1 hypothetical protein C6P54_11310 [Enterococcus mundtii]